MDNLTPEVLNRLYAAIDTLLAARSRILVAVDGPCTAGKTTLADILQKKYHCNVVHMDAFFLRPHQRTPQRLAQPGGNVDYERFLSEVLLPLQTGEAFFYRPFSCKEQTFTAAVAVTPAPVTVIEGTYALHPYFRDPYDLKVFLTIPAEIQVQRINQREEWKRERFFREWIPMEQLYFDTCRVQARSDLIL